MFTLLNELSFSRVGFSSKVYADHWNEQKILWFSILLSAALPKQERTCATRKCSNLLLFCITFFSPSIPSILWFFKSLVLYLVYCICCQEVYICQVQCYWEWMGTLFSKNVIIFLFPLHSPLNVNCQINDLLLFLAWRIQCQRSDSTWQTLHAVGTFIDTAQNSYIVHR